MQKLWAGDGEVTEAALVPEASASKERNMVLVTVVQDPGDVPEEVTHELQTGEIAVPWMDAPGVKPNP